MLGYMPFDPIEKRTEGTIRAPDGEVFRVTKGAPHVIAKLCRDPALLSKVMAVVDSFAERGIRSLAVARSKPGTVSASPRAPLPAAAGNGGEPAPAPPVVTDGPVSSSPVIPPTPLADGGAVALPATSSAAAAAAEQPQPPELSEEHEDHVEWEMLGILSFLDPPRPGTKEVLLKALEYGVDVKMITGDHVKIAKETARQLGLGTNILNADGLPTLDKDGKVPKDLQKLAPVIIDADGFAQAREAGCCR